MPLVFGGRTFHVAPDIDLVLEIEDELGGLPGLFERFKGNDWKASEAISIIHMMLHHCGQKIDWQELGKQLLSEGIGRYRKPVLDFLSLPVTGRVSAAA